MNQRQINLDKKLVFSLSKARIPGLRQLKYIKRYLTKIELLLIYLCFLVILASLFFIGTRFYNTHLAIVPIKGGDYTEGLIGSPKLINPLYAYVSDVDSDIASLVFSSLFKRGRQAELVNAGSVVLRFSPADFAAWTFYGDKPDTKDIAADKVAGKGSGMVEYRLRVPES